MESNEIKLSYEACVEELKVAKRELHAYQQEIESLKHENKVLRSVNDGKDNTIREISAARDAYRDCILIAVGKRKR